MERLGLEGRVILDGYIADTPGWLRDIDIFVTNSFSEGLQVALLEAMATGCYCLAHAWDGAEEALPPDQIYISEGELIQKVEAYIGLDDKAQRQLQERMRSIAEEKFDIEDRARDVLQVVESVLIERTPVQ